MEENTSNPAGDPVIKGFEVPSDGGSEFTRFESLASKLVKVSKTELDEELKKD